MSDPTAKPQKTTEVRENTKNSSVNTPPNLKTTTKINIPTTTTITPTITTNQPTRKCEKWTILYDKVDGFRVEKEDVKNNRLLNNTACSYLMPQEKLVSKDYVLGCKKFIISRRREAVKSFKRKDIELEKKAEALVSKQIERYNAVYVVSNKTLKYSMEEDFSKEDISQWPSTNEKVRLFKSSKSLLDFKVIKKEKDERMKAYEEALQQDIEEEESKPKFEPKKRIRFSNFASVARDRVEKVDKIVFNKSKKAKLNCEEKSSDTIESSDDEDYDVSELSSCVVSYDSLIQFAKDAKQRAEKRYIEELKDGIPLYDL